MKDALLFGEYSEKLQIRRIRKGKTVHDEIFDPVRKKFVVLQPEELVRQLVLQYLNDVCGVPFAWMRSEFGITVNERQKRCDIVVFDYNIKPKLIVECKRPTVDITQATFDQIANYNRTLQVPFLLVTNGRQAFCGEIFADDAGRDGVNLGENGVNDNEDVVNPGKDAINRVSTGGGPVFAYLENIPNFATLISK